MNCKRWLWISPTLLAVAPACTLLEVPFDPEDGVGGSDSTGGWPTGAGNTDGSGTGGWTASGSSSGYGGAFFPGSGGASAWPNVPGTEPEVGAGGSGLWGANDEDVVPLATTPVRIMGIASNDDYLYWITSTTRDGYQEDGRFYRMALEGGPVQAASYFNYPTKLEVTSQYAYAWIEDKPSQDYNPFFKVELWTGNYEPENTGDAVPERFYAFEHRAYFVHEVDGEARLFEHEHFHDSRQVSWQSPRDFAADDTYVYFQTDDLKTYRAPLAEPMSTELLSDAPMPEIALSGELLVGLDPAEHRLFTMPTTGGAWEVAVNLDTDFDYVDLVVQGDRFYVVDYENTTGITTGLLSEGEMQGWYMLGNSGVWHGREDALYFAQGDHLYRLDF